MDVRPNPHGPSLREADQVSINRRPFPFHRTYFYRPGASRHERLPRWHLLAALWAGFLSLLFLSLCAYARLPRPTENNLNAGSSSF